MTSTTRTSLRLLALLSPLAAPAWANGVVHIPEPTGGWSYPIDGWYHANSAYIFDQGITFGDDFAIVPTIDCLSFVRRDPASFAFFEFVASEVQITDPSHGGWASLSVGGSDFSLSVSEGVRTSFIKLVNDFLPQSEVGLLMSPGLLSFGDGLTAPDTDLARASTGVLQINGQTIVTQNALANYVTLDGTQTLTNKSINATQLTGSVTAAKGGTGLTSYTAGDLLYANGTSSLGKLPAASTGNVLLSGTSPSWGKVGLTTHVSGTLPVANGGTGATSLTGILKGNGVGAVTTVAAPAGDLVGTTATQTLSGKTLSAATLSGTTQATSISFGGAGAVSKIGTIGLSVGGGSQVDVVAGGAGGVIRLQASAGAIVFGPYATGPASPSISAFPISHPTNPYAQSVRLSSVGGEIIADGRFIAGTNNVSNDDLFTVGNGDSYPVWPETQSNAMSLQKNGKLRVANTVESKGGFRTPKMGDIEMGLFTEGADPTTLNDGLRYSTE